MSYPKKIYYLPERDECCILLEDLKEGGCTDEKEEVIIYAPVEKANIHLTSTIVFTDRGALK